jgi:hypothetical protein
MRSVIVAGLLAITTCAPSANTSEIPHPPFTAEVFADFLSDMTAACLAMVLYQGGIDLQSKLESKLSPAAIKSSDYLRAKVWLKEHENLLRDAGDCSVAAQIKWGVKRPLVSEKFHQMDLVIEEQCDKPRKERERRLREAHPPGNPMSEPQAHEAIAELTNIIDTDNQCYREIQTEWGFK